MKRAIVGSLAILLLVWTPTSAAEITVGDHWLIPNRADQQVPVLVSGGEDIAGMNFFATIGGGGAANGGVDGPGFEAAVGWAPAMKLGTIWDDTGWPLDNGTATTVYGHPFGAQFAAGSLDVFWNFPGYPENPLPPGTVATVPADGVLINVLVDTTGWLSGTWDLTITDAQPFGGDSTELLDDMGSALGGVAFSSGSITIADRGDTNLDGDVDFGDFNSLANNYTGSGGSGKVWEEGDFNGDGDVDFGDFNDLANNYTGSGGGGKAVPEPSTVVLLFMSAVGLAAYVGRKRRTA